MQEQIYLQTLAAPENRVEICHDRHDQRLCKICVNITSKLNQRGLIVYETTLIQFGADILKIVAVLISTAGALVVITVKGVSPIHSVQ